MEQIFRYKSVMLIDENEIDNLINQKMIEACNFAEKIYTFSGAGSALDFLKNIDKDKGFSDELIPDLIFLDINMPILDGFQFLEEYERFTDKIKRKTNILMVSSSMSPKDIERATMSKYVERYVNKPLSIKALESIVL